MHQINQSFETEEGTVIFNGEVSDDEYNYIIQQGLLALIDQGFIKPTYPDLKELHWINKKDYWIKNDVEKTTVIYTQNGTRKRQMGF